MGLKVTPVPGRGMTPWRPEIEPLPARTEPYPDDRPLDYDEVKSALWHGRGNIRAAAAFLKTPPARLGALLRRDQSLADIRAEAAELIVDHAEHAILEALDDEDPLRKDGAAHFVLEKAGKGRGWSRDGTTGIGVAVAVGSPGVGQVTVRWQTEPK
jgi:hypothetical protein